MTDLTKTCSKCSEIKPLNLFSRSARSKDGLQGRCKECFAEYRKANAERIAKCKAEYYKDNAERIAEYRKANAEQKAAYNAEYYKDNAEQIAAYNAEYYKANAEQIGKYKAEYRKANRSIMNASCAKYNATKLQATPSWLTKAHLKQIRLVYQEAKLLSDRGFVHHVDHIVPLQGKNVSGLHVPRNLRAIPASVNRSKFNATPDKLPTVRYF